MSIILRGSKYHYRFRMNGVDHSGVCLGCEVPSVASPREILSIEKKAKQFEAEVKLSVTQEISQTQQAEAEIRKNKTVRALVENYKYELTGGKPVTLEEAFALAEAKPSKRKAKSSYAALRKTYWEDFVRFMGDSYPDVRDLASVRRVHCEAYV